MSNFNRFNHKSLINPAYHDSEQYIPLKDIPFRKAAELYAINPEMVYSIRAMYRSTSDYGDQIIGIVNPETAPDDVFRIAFPHKFVETINVDDAGLISDCNNGLARFYITQYHSKRFNKDLNDFKFI
jgi:hypothetical protein